MIFHRFVEKEEIEKPGLLLGIGCLGLLVNLIGLVLLYGMYDECSCRHRKWKIAYK